MTGNWVSVILLLGWLILAGSALRARQLNVSKAVMYALIWGAIFLAVASLFTAMG
jgi:hypothetical protein